MFRGGMGNINQLMKMAKQLQMEAAKLKEEIERKDFTGTAGGGAVKVTVKGSGEVVSVEIDPDLLQPEERETLQDLIVVAVNQALKEARETMTKELEKITGGLGIDFGGLF
ncbi:MAG: YbaB/EbfC family nucleoid-associated protein [Desulfurobacteriaceae bacterium]